MIDSLPGENLNANYHAQAVQLVARLERLSADSVYAHRASGLRGALLRALDHLEANQAVPGLESLLEQGFKILVLAAREIEPSQ